MAEASHVKTFPPAEAVDPAKTDGFLRVCNLNCRHSVEVVPESSTVGLPPELDARWRSPTIGDITGTFAEAKRHQSHWRGACLTSSA